MTGDPKKPGISSPLSDYELAIMRAKVAQDDRRQAEFARLFDIMQAIREEHLENMKTFEKFESFKQRAQDQQASNSVTPKSTLTKKERNLDQLMNVYDDGLFKEAKNNKQGDHFLKCRRDRPINILEVYLRIATEKRSPESPLVQTAWDFIKVIKSPSATECLAILDAHMAEKEISLDSATPIFNQMHKVLEAFKAVEEERATQKQEMNQDNDDVGLRPQGR